MMFKVCFDKDPSIDAIYQVWFREMGFNEEDLFEFVEDLHDPRGIMRVRHVKSGRNSLHTVHKHMFVPLEPTTKLEEWL